MGQQNQLAILCPIYGKQVIKNYLISEDYLLWKLEQLKWFIRFIWFNSRDLGKDYSADVGELEWNKPNRTYLGWLFKSHDFSALFRCILYCTWILILQSVQYNIYSNYNFLLNIFMNLIWGAQWIFRRTHLYVLLRTSTFSFWWSKIADESLFCA